jgi:uncharacterized protein (UPF0210 family)
MEIRSVTFFSDPRQPLKGVARAAADTRLLSAAAGYRLQSVRLTTTPFPTWLADRAQAVDLLSWCGEAGIDYLALGPVCLDDDVSFLDMLPHLLGARDALFASAEIADRTGRIDTGRVTRVAELVRELAAVREDGFVNLYFTAAANCPPGSPFFPVSYHQAGSEEVCFAIAAEAAELATKSFRVATTITEARFNLVRAIEDEAAKLVQLAQSVESRHGIPFAGIDLSLAPFPDEARSVGGALEMLGVPATGGHGSLFAAAFMADCVNRAEFPRCGFSALMFPVLEDATLSRRAAEGWLTISDLLLYSAVCGAGLDTVPLPGDISVEEIAGMLLDLAALSVRADKPLTARLMPLPGLAAGDPVSFDFSYFAESCVMATKGIGPAGLLMRGEQVSLLPLGWRGKPI